MFKDASLGGDLIIRLARRAALTSGTLGTSGKALANRM